MSSMNNLIVIPARYGSTRFPAKPLAKIQGVTLLERVWRIATSAVGAESVVIATDSDAIAEHAATFGARAVMTSAECKNGTERTYAATRALGVEPEVTINLQGDAVLTPPWILRDLISTLSQAPSEVQIATPCVALSVSALEALVSEKKVSESRGTTVVFDNRFRALYFSRRVLPFRRDTSVGVVYRHIGVYAYRYAGLMQLIALEEGVLEKHEGLEQLRALENGIPIQVVPVDYRGRSHWSVDHPDDVRVAEEIMQREGELVS